MIDRIRIEKWAAVLAIFMGISTSAGVAQAAVITVSNNTPILIPASGTSGPASLFPSTINVSGISNVTDVNVILNGLSHTWSGDLEILVQGPGGQKVVLMNDVGGSSDWTNDTVTFSDGAPAITTASPGSDGIFSPTGLTNCLPICAGAGHLLSVYNGLDPTGVWSLYINDDAGQDVGRLGDGWSLQFTTASVVPLPAALPLMASALGLLGLFGWRRKRAAAA